MSRCSSSNYENQRALIEGENVNLSEPNDAKSFIITMLQITAAVIIIIFSCDFLSGVFISTMPDKTQKAVETAISAGNSISTKAVKDKKYIEKLEHLNYIKEKIIRQDKNLQGKSEFNISIIKNKDVNACVLPDGSIFFTTAAIDENYSEQELAFILAHELGHYAHRDHLKTISRQLMIYAVFSFFGGNKAASKTINSISNTASMSYSRSQERNADLYASEMLKKIYGTNQGGIDFFNKLKQKENTPEFLYYFASHPSLNKRIELLK